MEPALPPAPVPASQPHLNPQFCFDTTALRDFLRLSRSTVDDSVSLHLNELITPARTPFLPSMTSKRTFPSSASRRQIPGAHCHTFKSDILFPSWQSRQDVFTYCSQVAQDPDDPPLAQPLTPRSMRMPSDKMAVASAPYAAQAEHDMQDDRLGGRTRSRNYWGQEQVVDERTDPYSARDYSYTREGKAQVLKEVLANEEGVERIVRARTWSVLGERCLDDEGGAASGTAASAGYEEEWRAWREGR